MKFSKILKDDWYIQGFPAVPLYLNFTGYSGFVKTKNLPLSFTAFFVRYEKGYCEYGYYNPDFNRLWKEIKQRISDDPLFLQKRKKENLAKWKQNYKLFKKIDQTDLEKISEQKLIQLFRQTCQAQIDSCALNHVIIEPVGIEIEKEFKNNLLEYIGPSPEFNQYYSDLTAPIKQSWLSDEEAALKKIASLPKNKQEARLKAHLKKYFWIQNSYRSPKKLTLGKLRQRMAKLKTEKLVIEKPEIIKNRKKKLTKKFNLDKEFQKQIKIIDFISQWQDERKAYIFLSIEYLNKVVSEISRRTKIDLKYLHYLSYKDIAIIKTLSKIKSLKKELINREKGCYFYIQGLNKEEVVTGAPYKKLVTLKNKLEKEKTQIEDALHGSVANTGTAMGRVVICKNISHLSKVQEGDILVASMTRPEFMPAIKKAAAIVTDEGGITCHAAIVSRELGKPCIIGTKHATKVLIDGMLVEVKANHGIVKIIKQNYAS